MTQDFVRYCPEVERADPTFAPALQTVLDDIKRYIAQSVEAPGATRAPRDAHAKGYGLARGEVEILGGLPAAYAQGIYGTPGRNEAMVRFSNGQPALRKKQQRCEVIGSRKPKRVRLTRRRQLPRVGNRATHEERRIHERRKHMEIKTLLLIRTGHHSGGDDDPPPPAALALACPPKRTQRERGWQVASVVQIRIRPWAGEPPTLARAA